MVNFPSAQDLVDEALASKPSDMNVLHLMTWKLMIKYRTNYYKERVDAFLRGTSLKGSELEEVRKKMLEPMTANGVEYSNFMEEASRRISQTFQVISGNLAELCVESELQKLGLKDGIDYVRKKGRTDFSFFYRKSKAAQHNLEVKNVKLRERGLRGLEFDGDSILGFFDSPEEFTEDTVKRIDAFCTSHKGYCYVPPNTLKAIKYKTTRFKSNLDAPKDMAMFVSTGVMS